MTMTFLTSTNPAELPGNVAWLELRDVFAPAAMR